MKAYPFKNLVFEGGGVKGIAYLGMLEVLDSKGILSQIERLAGASAGAITSAIVSFDLPFDELKKIADTLDYSKIPDKENLRQEDIVEMQEFAKVSCGVEGKFGGIFDDIVCIYRLIKRYGWYSSDYIYTWLKDTIAGQFNNKKKPPYTFADFRNASLHKSGKPFADLYVIGTDISNHCTRVFSADLTPDVEVATAVRISMSIPLFFESIDFEYPGLGEENIFSDGGVMRNYPINIFDYPEFGNSFRDNVNIETLGGHLFTPKNCQKKKAVTNIVFYIENLFESLLQVQDDAFNNNPDDQARTINIDNKCVSTTDFNIKPGDETYCKLYNSGKEAAEKYLIRITK
ncbi:MAG: patatin-like phospholipase family protein [Candidatus Omnitrophota bacterium]